MDVWSHRKHSTCLTIILLYTSVEVIHKKLITLWVLSALLLILFYLRLVVSWIRSPLFQKVTVQLSELFQETPVWDDSPAVFYVVDGINNCHVTADHQVGQEESCWAASPHDTVHQKLIWKHKRYKGVLLGLGKRLTLKLSQQQVYSEVW